MSKIQKMKAIHNRKELDPKSDWTSLEEINNLASLMRDTKKGASSFEISLYSQHGSLLEVFVTTAEDEKETLERVVAELVNKNQSRYFYEVGDITEEDAEEMGLIYVDATMNGTDRPVYIDGLNLKIFEI